MKTSPTKFSFQRWLICFCLVLAAMTARCQPFGGIIANGSIDLRGNSVTVDSFNSADPNHSIWLNFALYHGQLYGVYSSALSYSSNSLPSRTSDATMAAGSDILNVGSAFIYGYVDTAPDGIINLNNNGSVGDLNWVYPQTSGIEAGHAETNMTQRFYSYSLPTPTSASQSNWKSIPLLPTGSIIRIGGYWTNALGKWTNMGGTTITNTGGGFTIGGIAYHLVITNIPAATNYVYYAFSNTLNLNTFVDAPNTVLYLPNGLSLSGNTAFTINTNADITIYSGANVFLSGNGVIDNMSQYARALRIYDLAGDPISISAAGNGIGTAYIYAPSSSVSFTGGGSSTYGFVGGIFCSNLSVNGHYLFHYDESLGSIPPLIITQPGLSGFFSPASGWFSCHLTGETGMVYTIEASTNLIDWTPLWTNTSSFDFTDITAKHFPERFYRSFYNP